MDDNWVKAYQTGQLIRAELARQILELAGIAAVLMNKQDSSYLAFGMCEVHVPAADLAKAQTILSDEEALKQPE